MADDTLRIVTGGFEGANEDKSGVRSQTTHDPRRHGLAVLAADPGNSPFHVPDNFTKDFNALPGTLVDYVNMAVHSSGGYVRSIIGTAPNPSPPGVSSFDIRLQPGNSINPVSVPLPTGTGFGKKPDNKQVPVVTPNPAIPLIPQQLRNLGTHYGHSVSERLGSWQKVTDIKTAEGAFGSIPSLGMLQGLPGMILSLASSFKGLSKQQKNQIKANTTPEMYTMIEETLSSTTDVGDLNSVSLQNRVHKETFANNMVILLSQCKTHDDLQECIYKLRTDSQLQGKDQLPTVEYKVKGAFGETGLIIDAYGEYKQNVSAEVAKAEADFMQFLTQGTDNIEVLSKFEGQITANTLTVNLIYFGHLQKGKYIYIEGPDVTDNTQIASFGTGANGNTGIYNLTLSSTTLPNTDMILYSAIPNPEQQAESAAGGGGGLGGMVGFFGQNMFGEAAKLLGEQIPTMSPQGSAAVMKVIAGLKGGLVDHTKAKYLKIAKKFAGRWIPGL